MENDIPPVNRIDQIKAELAGLEGQRIRVRANMGRSRIVERTGTVEIYDVTTGERLMDYSEEE